MTKPADPMFAVLAAVKVERRRQVQDEGYDTLHDDLHTGGELAAAASAFAIAETRPSICKAVPLDVWPKDWQEPRFKGHRENCIKAMALLCAEVERLDRARQREN